MNKDEGLYNRYRPKTLKGLIGQDETVAALDVMRRKKRVPHAILLTGPSGVGKTTIALQIRDWIGCSDADGDFTHVNASDKGGIDTIRRILETIQYKPMGGGKARLWLFDESHRLSSEAQETLLIPLEKPPAHAYFVLCTTDPTKLKVTIKTRCTTFDLKPIGTADLVTLVKAVARKEGGKVSDVVAAKIAEVSGGSARLALVQLEKVSGLSGDKARLRALEPANQSGPVFDLMRAMFGWQTGFRPDWDAARKTLDEIKKAGEGIEGVRQMVLSTCAGQIIKGGLPAQRGYQIFQVFQYDFFSTGSTGWNGLVAATYAACLTGGGQRR